MITFEYDVVAAVDGDTIILSNALLATASEAKKSTSCTWFLTEEFSIVRSFVEQSKPSVFFAAGLPLLRELGSAP